MKKGIIFGLVGGTILVATGVVAYLKRKAIEKDIKEIDEIIHAVEGRR